jgi:hypothetical protein
MLDIYFIKLKKERGKRHDIYIYMCVRMDQLR